MADMLIRPQEWLNRLLSGQIEMHETPKAIQSWARFSIFEGAEAILRMETIEDRRAALKKIPDKIRPYVESEIKRLWDMR